MCEYVDCTADVVSVIRYSFSFGLFFALFTPVRLCNYLLTRAVIIIQRQTRQKKNKQIAYSTKVNTDRATVNFVNTHKSISELTKLHTTQKIWGKRDLEK